MPHVRRQERHISSAGADAACASSLGATVPARSSTASRPAALQCPESVPDACNARLLETFGNLEEDHRAAPLKQGDDEALEGRCPVVMSHHFEPGHFNAQCIAVEIRHGFVSIKSLVYQPA